MTASPKMNLSICFNVSRVVGTKEMLNKRLAVLLRMRFIQNRLTNNFIQGAIRCINSLAVQTDEPGK